MILEQGREQSIHIERLSGTGGTVNLTTATNDDGSLSTARMIVDQVNAEATPELVHRNVLSCAFIVPDTSGAA